jgi:hypothetical protein
VEKGGKKPKNESNQSSLKISELNSVDNLKTKDSGEDRGSYNTGKSRNNSIHIQNFNFFMKNTSSNTKRDDLSSNVRAE